MPTDYDPIAEEYGRSKYQPWRTHVETFTLMNLIGDPTGKTVVDLACGEGFYTRPPPPIVSTALKPVPWVNFAKGCR